MKKYFIVAISAFIVLLLVLPIILWVNSDSLSGYYSGNIDGVDLEVFAHVEGKKLVFLNIAGSGSRANIDEGRVFDGKTYFDYSHRGFSPAGILTERTFSGNKVLNPFKLYKIKIQEWLSP